jgi:phosphoribosylglycinamide formyltransferase-1
MVKRPRVAIFVSGSGTTFMATADAIHDGLVDFDIGLVITDHEDAGVLGRVKDVNKQYGFDIKTEVINKERYPAGGQGRGQTKAEAKVTLDSLKKYQIDHLALMGCLRIIAPQVIDEWGWKPGYAKKDPKNKGIYLARMTNTHPGIFPETVDTYGIHTQEKVLKLGLYQTAHTFHVVSNGIDEGPTIAEHRVAVFAPQNYPAGLADTPEKIFARVQRVEKANLPLDLDAFLKNQAIYLQPKRERSET